MARQHTPASVAKDVTFESERLDEATLKTLFDPSTYKETDEPMPEVVATINVLTREEQETVLTELARKVHAGEGGLLELSTGKFIVVMPNAFIFTGKASFEDGPVVDVTNGYPSNWNELLSSYGPPHYEPGGILDTSKHVYVAKWQEADVEQVVQRAQAVLRQLEAGEVPTWFSMGTEFEGYAVALNEKTGMYEIIPGHIAGHPEAINGQFEDSPQHTHDFVQFARNMGATISGMHQTAQQLSTAPDTFMQFCSTLETPVDPDSLQMLPHPYVGFMVQILMNNGMLDYDSWPNGAKEVYDKLAVAYGYETALDLIQHKNIAVWFNCAAHVHTLPIVLKEDESEIDLNSGFLLYLMHYGPWSKAMAAMMRSTGHCQGIEVAAGDARDATRGMLPSARRPVVPKDVAELVEIIDESLRQGLIPGPDRVHPYNMHLWARMRLSGIGTVEGVGYGEHPHLGFRAALIAGQRLMAVRAMERITGDKNPQSAFEDESLAHAFENLLAEGGTLGLDSKEVQNIISTAVELGIKYKGLAKEALCFASYFAGSMCDQTNSSVGEYMNAETGGLGSLADLKKRIVREKSASLNLDEPGPSANDPRFPTQCFNTIVEEQGKGSAYQAQLIQEHPEQLLFPQHLRGLLKNSMPNLQGQIEQLERLVFEN